MRRPEHPRVDPAGGALVARRPALAAVLAVVIVALLAGCPSGPRELTIVDGTGGAHAAALGERVAAFRKTSSRAVRVLSVPSAAAALELATRGDAEVALVDASAPLGDFVTGRHGRDAGTMSLAGAQLRVLEVSAATHPKIDAEGAAALARFLGAR